MSLKKTKQETLDELRLALINVNGLYKSGCVNWSGTTFDTNEYYSEVISHELLLNLNTFQNIIQVTRKNSYFNPTHLQICFDLAISNRLEEIFAKRITGLVLDELGWILDYQIPLKDTNIDKGLGKIDLISFSEANQTLYLIELKHKSNTTDSLLKSTLEIYTYYKCIDKMKLLKDYMTYPNSPINEQNINNIKVVPAVLIMLDSSLEEELSFVEQSERPMFKSLALFLGVKLFTIDSPAVYETTL